MAIARNPLIVIAALLTALPLSVSAQLATPAQVELLEGSLQVLDDGYSTTILGEVVNTGELPAAGLQVSLVGFDAQGNAVQVGQARSHLRTWCGNGTASTVTPCLLPGETAFFRYYLPPSSPAASEFRVIAQAFESELEVLTIPVELNAPIQPRESAYGSALDVSLVNTGAEDLVGLNATVVFRDAAGQLLDASSSSVEAERIGGFAGGIRAGESIEFSLYSSLELGEIESYELWFNGRPYDGGLFRYAVVGVAHRPGYSGAQWRSSMSVANHSGAAGQMRLRFFAQEGPVVERTQPIRDLETLHWDEVVDTLFEVAEASAGFVRIDATVPLTITARTANANASAGSYGQLLPTVTPGMTAAASAGGLLTPIPDGTRFRTNLGFVNFGDQQCQVPLSYNVQVDQMVFGTSITIPANSWIQLNDVSTSTGMEGSTVVGEMPECGSVWAYASVIDRQTGDPVTVALDPQQTIHLGPSSPRGGGRSGSWGWSD